jgi:hypothetical protein
MIIRKDKRKLEGNTNYFFEFLKIKEHFFQKHEFVVKKGNRSPSPKLQKI